MIQIQIGPRSLVVTIALEKNPMIVRAVLIVFEFFICIVLYKYVWLVSKAQFFFELLEIDFVVIELHQQ